MDQQRNAGLGCAARPERLLKTLDKGGTMKSSSTVATIRLDVPKQGDVSLFLGDPNIPCTTQHIITHLDVDEQGTLLRGAGMTHVFADTYWDRGLRTVEVPQASVRVGMMYQALNILGASDDRSKILWAKMACSNHLKFDGTCRCSQASCDPQ